MAGTTAGGDPDGPDPGLGDESEQGPQSAPAHPVPAPEGRISVPVPRPPKPRLLQDGRDMFWSMAPLVVVCILLAGALGMCSFTPNGPTAGKPPTYDAHAALQADAREFAFPIREPQLPDGWQANSGRRDGIERGRGGNAHAEVSFVGYLSPSGAFMNVAQSNADEEKLVAKLSSSVVAHGAVDVDGVSWVAYEGGEGTEPVWATRLVAPRPGTTVAITGAGTPEEFRIVARGLQSASPL